MTKKELKLEDLKFNITNNMYDTLLKSLLIKQMIKNKAKNKEDKNLLMEELKNLNNSFVDDFRKNNKDECELYLKIINSKKY